MMTNDDHNKDDDDDDKSNNKSSNHLPILCNRKAVHPPPIVCIYLESPTKIVAIYSE